MGLIKKYLKNERGLTLIELLAVVVILGIIAAIAIPSIGGLIDNTKKDAHLANATQMISSAKTAVSSNNELVPPAGNSIYLSLGYLIDEGYLDAMKDPDGTGPYNREAVADVPVPTAVATASSVPPTGIDSYVKVSADSTGKKISYEVKLKGTKKQIVETAEKDLARSKVTN